MKLFAIPGTAENLTPVNGQSARLLKSWDFDEGSSTGMLPVTVESATEATRDGNRRVMLKVATQMPRSVVESTCGTAIDVKAKKDLSIQTHLVISAPADLVRMATTVNQGALDISQVGKVLAWQIRALLACVFKDGSVPVSQDLLSISGPVVRGLLGLEPLDAVSGEYGKQTV